jgi:superfamily II DNA or RNA helicase
VPRSPSFSVGDRVTIDGEPGAIGRIVSAGQRLGSSFYYDVQLDSDEPLLYPEEDLRLYESGTRSPVSWLMDQPLAEAREFAEYFTLLKLKQRLTNVLYSYLSSRTVFRVYQFKPILKLLTSPYQRLLIADEVGLGKTIEAGLVWAELDARMRMDRVLVVCPAALRRKWQLEMERRFDREIDILTSTSQLHSLLERYRRQGESMRFHAIASTEMLRGDSALEGLRATNPIFDLVIVDEAHHMRNRGTASYELGEFLSEVADYMLFLTATPLNLGQPDLFNLLHLLLPEEFDNFDVFESVLEPNQWVNAALRKLNEGYPPDTKAVEAILRRVEGTSQARRLLSSPLYKDALDHLKRAEFSRRDLVETQRRINDLNTLSHAYNRTRKRDLSEKIAVRRAWRIDVSFTDEEWRTYEAVRRYVIDRFRLLQGKKTPPGFATVMAERQAASCLPAARAYFLEALERARLDADLSEGEEDMANASSVSSRLQDREREAIRRLVDELGARSNRDSKLNSLTTKLTTLFGEKPRSQILIFSFFRKSLAYLLQELSERGYATRKMDGATPRDERETLIEEFRSGSFQILLSSEVGAEGLDFQFCQYLFNYDLPWNPMRLEQRIGRLDRFGQLHDEIFIGNFHIPGTIDTDIFERLYDRIGIFERSIGELEPILGEALKDLQQNVLTQPLTSEERRRETDRIAQAIELHEMDLEQFEEQRESLVGQDEYVVQQLESITRERRYMTQDELSRLFLGFLRRVVGGRSAMHKDPADKRVWYLTTNPGFSDLLRRHISNPSRATVNLLAQLEAGAPLRITFDPEAAYQTSAEFLNVRHPFIDAIVNFYEKNRGLHRAGAIKLHTESPGDFLFFVFLLQSSGLSPRHELVAVAVDMESRTVDEQISEAILPVLSEVDAETPESHPPLLPEIVNKCYEAAAGWVDRRRRALKDELQNTNQALVVARQESLRQSRDLRVARIREVLESVSDPRIKRMKTSQIDNVNQTVEHKLAQLENQRGVSVSIKVLAGGYAHAGQAEQKGQRSTPSVQN